MRVVSAPMPRYQQIPTDLWRPSGRAKLNFKIQTNARRTDRTGSGCFSPDVLQRFIPLLSLHIWANTCEIVHNSVKSCDTLD